MDDVPPSPLRQHLQSATVAFRLVQVLDKVQDFNHTIEDFNEAGIDDAVEKLGLQKATKTLPRPRLI